MGARATAHPQGRVPIRQGPSPTQEGGEALRGGRPARREGGAGTRWGTVAPANRRRKRTRAPSRPSRVETLPARPRHPAAGHGDGGTSPSARDMIVRVLPQAAPPPRSEKPMGRPDLQSCLVPDRASRAGSVLKRCKVPDPRKSSFFLLSSFFLELDGADLQAADAGSSSGPGLYLGRNEEKWGERGGPGHQGSQ
jgi:hypothetical protein